MSLKEKLKSNPKLKELTLRLLMPRNQARPRNWVRWFVNPFLFSFGKRSVIRPVSRMDLLPFNKFHIGEDSTIEDYCTVNNGVGDVFIGDRTRIGISSVLIGPVHIGHDVMLAQHIVISGLNHSYADISLPISLQPVTKAQVTIEDEAWIGANAVITAGVTVGKHSVVAAGSVVTKNVPPYSVVAGNPAKVLKKYNDKTGEWDRV
ncbi:MAG: acyltransferase [Bacteroidota bacterium]